MTHIVGDRLDTIDDCPADLFDPADDLTADLLDAAPESLKGIFALTIGRLLLFDVPRDRIPDGLADYRMPDGDRSALVDFSEAAQGVLSIQAESTWTIA